MSTKSCVSGMRSFAICNTYHLLHVFLNILNFAVERASFMLPVQQASFMFALHEISDSHVGPEFFCPDEEVT